ncbi:GDSL esterase/lipase [Canna indica]|uniref:GDSL esterase/lipase n=1 Tax=Canna indica TaxID=4628 RepID=A0AAQ3L099_9LILI|nr:GDSL esterase/lipase [Canna indica]
MASSSSSASSSAAAVVLCIWLCSFSSSSRCHGAPTVVPALYVLGDSLTDVGNNNHLHLSLIKADFPHNGVDYAGREATGRFSNGKNSADFIAEKLGLPPSPPYLSLSHASNSVGTFLSGVNFASGGAGVLNSTHRDKCLSMNKQIDYYASVYGSIVQQLGSYKAQAHLSNSIFALSIGSNDILGYVRSSSSNKLKHTPQTFIDSLASSLQQQLRRIYNLGARKYVFIGGGPIGCCPALRHDNRTRECNVEANHLSVEYNKRASSLLQQMSIELSDMSYSFFDTYNALLEFINNPDTYGFVEVKSACCGLGKLKARVACIPISSYCSNRRNHIFWDMYHPTEATYEKLTITAFDGSVPYVYPINIKQLVAM